MGCVSCFLWSSFIWVYSSSSSKSRIKPHVFLLILEPQSVSNRSYKITKLIHWCQGITDRYLPWCDYDYAIKLSKKGTCIDLLVAKYPLFNTGIFSLNFYFIDGNLLILVIFKRSFWKSFQELWKPSLLNRLRFRKLTWMLTRQLRLFDEK